MKKKRPLLHINSHAKLVFVGCENCEAECCNGNTFSLSSILLSEVQNSAKLFPIVFIERDKKIEMKIIYSLKKGVPCLYLDSESKKCTIYDRIRPFTCTIYPFDLKFKVMRESKQYSTISFDPRCKGLQESEKGTQILKDNGELSEVIFASFFDNDYVARYEEHLHVTNKFLELVSELDLLAWEKIVFGNKLLTGKGFDVELDVLKISEQKLAALDEDAKMRLQTAGYLNIINAHLKSLFNYNRLYEAMTAVEKPRQSVNMLDFTFGQ
jgi:Fe-S-cluster containining protein